jgi:hypothetical protein
VDVLPQYCEQSPKRLNYVSTMLTKYIYYSHCMYEYDCTSEFIFRLNCMSSSQQEKHIY